MQTQAQTQDPFQLAVAAVRRLPPGDVDSTIKLQFYALFKQATVGDVNVPRPGGFLDLAGKAKWDAWSAHKGMTQDNAKTAYVKLLNMHCPGWSRTAN
jgi:diazepam-binding inhibitor (GABA receptor modulating acyl-CoA-binding protein)